MFCIHCGEGNWSWKAWHKNCAQCVMHGSKSPESMTLREVASVIEDASKELWATGIRLWSGLAALVDAQERCINHT